MMRLSHYSARRPQEVQHLIHCCLAWYEFMPSVPNNGRTPFFSFDLDRKYSSADNSCHVDGGRVQSGMQHSAVARASTVQGV